MRYGFAQLPLPQERTALNPVNGHQMGASLGLWEPELRPRAEQGDGIRFGPQKPRKADHFLSPEFEGLRVPCSETIPNICMA
jgi:hypothetical protein